MEKRRLKRSNMKEAVFDSGYVDVDVDVDVNLYFVISFIEWFVVGCSILQHRCFMLKH